MTFLLKSLTIGRIKMRPPEYMKQKRKPFVYQIIERETIRKTGIVTANSYDEADEKARYSPEEIEWQDNETIRSEMQVDLL